MELRTTPKNGVETEKIVKDLFWSMYREDSHFENLIGEVQIDTVTWLGKYTGERNRPIQVTCAMLWDQNLILKNKANLPKGVYVEEEFPFEIQERRNILRHIVRLAANHRNYREKVTLWHDKMILDNKEYGVNDLCQLPSEISPMLAC